jgi:hypothetical protein
VRLCAAGELEYKKEPRIGPEFVNALAQIVTSGVDKNVPTGFDDGTRRFSDFGMKKWFRSSQPNSGRADRANASGALLRRVPFKFG